MTGQAGRFVRTVGATRARGWHAASLLLAVAIAIAVGQSPFAAGTISLTAVNTPYTQNFDTLASSATASTLPAGWELYEAGTSANVNTAYTAGNGSGNAGDTYSFGATGSSERAFGTLLSGTITPTIGASFTNNTGATINSLAISYTGEQWRLGAAGRGADRFDFQYSLSATSLSTGSWTDVNELDFSSPITSGTAGALDGNAAANGTTISYTLTGLSIPSGATFWIRWSDYNATSSDDGLAVDDFSVTPSTDQPVEAPPSGVGAATPASVAAGGTTLLTVTPTAGTPAIPIAFVSADLSSIGGSSAQDFVTSDGIVYSYVATVGASILPGPKSLDFYVWDSQGRLGTGTIGLTVQAPALPVTPIHDIQGSGATSTYVGQAIATTGVVTARRYNNGFFLQAPDSQIDADPNTSEGIFVFTSSPPPAAAAVGTCVRVEGVVSEYIPGGDPYSPPMTEISPTSVTSLGACPLPAAVTLTAADLPPTGALDELERFEGMRVAVPFLRVVAPTQGSTNEGSATGTSNGVFYGVINGTARPFREPGIEVLDPLPAGTPDNVPRFDFNPERLRVDSDGQVGASRIEVTAGALLSNVVGVLDYAYRTWTILPDGSAPPAVSGNVEAAPVPAPAENEFTVGSFNLERFYDTSDDPLTEDAVLTAAAFSKRLNKASLAIRNVMRTPDILGVEEVENLSTLQALGSKINSDAAAAGDPNPDYVAYLVEGNDIGGIDVGFLVKSSRVTVLDVVQFGKSDTYTTPGGIPETLNDRPPLVLTAEVHGPSGTLPVTVIVNHLRSLSGIDDAVDGARVRAKRLAQAQFLASLIQQRQAADPHERIISVGDYNAFQVNDGYVDVIGTILGTPAPADEVVLSGPVTVNPWLIDLATEMPAADRYSFSYDGTAQVLDHIIVNAPARQRLSRVHYARSNADFPESYRSSASRPERVSDHDMPVAYFVFPDAPVLQLQGSNPMSVECCSTFTDPGATASDSDWGDITSFIQVAGTVNTKAVGAYTLTYSVSNGYTTSTATRTVNVVDTTPPTLTLVGNNPMSVEVGSVFVDPGATAEDTCAANLTSAIRVTSNVDANRVGSYRITYEVSDGSNTTSVTRTVNVVDTTPPVVSEVVPSRSSLWPPNHLMVTVGLKYTVTDNSGAANCSASIASSEPANGTGDGDTAPDWLAVDGRTVQLRSERAGTGSGRVYTLTVTCEDASHNATIRSAAVNVPKNQK